MFNRKVEAGNALFLKTGHFALPIPGRFMRFCKAFFC